MRYNFKQPNPQFKTAPFRGGMPGWKRNIDLIGCVAALPLLLLCTLVMWILSWLISPGPVFFCQERVGHRGKRFKIYKFRTMFTGADTRVHQAHFKQLMQSNTPMVKLDSRRDARLIPGAWLLRASGLDELPQLINVLRGEMSIVGPRPCLPAENESYLPHQRERLNAVPGLTGLWQVSGKNRTTFEEMIRLDIHYSRHLALVTDVRIILTTLPALLIQIVDTHRLRKTAKPAAPGVPANLGSPS